VKDMDKKLLDKALMMSPNERVIFAELILASLEHEDEKIRLAWLSEVKARIRAVEDGRAKILDFNALYNAG